MYYTKYLEKNNPRLSRLTTERTWMEEFHSTAQTKALRTDHSELSKKNKSTSWPVKQLPKKNVKLLENIQLSYEQECDRIQEEFRIRSMNANKPIQEALLQSKQFVDEAKRQVQMMIQQRHQRSLNIYRLTDICQSMMKIKNKDLKIISFLILSKVAKLYKLIFLAINLAKFAKRYSDSEPYIKYKIKAYKYLGQLMIALRQDHAKLYITKYLMCSWKLQSQNDELKAYDLLGMYYFYEGNITQATLFHSKMVLGETVSIKSSLKKLGISKLEQGSIGKSRKDKFFTLEETDFAISSDDEPFEIIFDANENYELLLAKKHIEETLQKQKKPSLLQNQLRKMPNFDKNNIKRSLQELKQGNNFIRLPKNDRAKFTEDFDIHEIKGLPKRSNVQIGLLKEPVLLNHKSPNRCLINYQYLELNKQSGAKNVVSIDPFYEGSDMFKILKQFNKFSHILHLTSDWLGEKTLSYEQL